jgi:hypothetical protein
MLPAKKYKNKCADFLPKKSSQNQFAKLKGLKKVLKVILSNAKNFKTVIIKELIVVAP